jgi:hypothetical protein
LVTVPSSSSTYPTQQSPSLLPETVPCPVLVK